MQLTAYLALRHECLRHAESEHYCESIGAPLPRQSCEKLKTIVKDLDELHTGTSVNRYNSKRGLEIVITHDQDVVIAEGGLTTMTEHSVDVKRSGELFELIHKVVRDFEVSPDLYVRLGCAFDEIEVKPKTDTARAIALANVISEYNLRIPDGCGLRRMKWILEKKGKH